MKGSTTEASHFLPFFFHAFLRSTLRFMINGDMYVIEDKSIYQSFLSINFYYEEYSCMQIKNADKLSDVIS
jgi:hypothetical protein